MKKRVLAGLMAVYMVLAVLPSTAIAAGTEEEKPIPQVCTQDETCQAEVHEEGCPLYQAPEAETCTQDGACRAEVHAEGCPLYQAPETETCTQDGACRAEVHEEGCPLYQAPEAETCTQDDTCRAEVHEESCPLYQAPEAETCTQDGACRAEVHEEGCPLYQAPVSPDENGGESAPPVGGGDELPVVDDPSEETPPAENNTVQAPQEAPAPADFLTVDVPTEYEKVLTVSKESGAFSTIQAALESITEDVGGAVLLQVDADLQPGRNAVLSIPADKGISSFTIGTANADGVTIGGSYQEFSLYANGVPLIIDEHVTLDSYATIYGGGTEPVSDGGASITVMESASVGTIYGGGRESHVNGDISIAVYGKAGSIYGGGYAYANSADGDKTAAADVTGDITITVSGENPKINRLYGGGHAYVNSNIEALQTLQANVTGSITINLDCKLASSAEIYGGGYAHVIMSSRENMSTRRLHADVTGDIKIAIGGDTQASSSSFSNFPYFYGGGHAETGLNTRDAFTPDVIVSADVDGHTKIDAAADNHATSGYDGWDASMVKQMYGGGVANGKYSSARVTGDTSVITSRKGQGSGGGDMGGIYGGGRATQAGNARVSGSTYVRILRAASQADGHENAKAVIGGGAAGSGADATVEGSTTVVIDGDISFESSGIGVIGGGRAFEANAKADVLGGVSITLNGNTNMTQNRIIGGGHAYGAGSSAKVGSPEQEASISVAVLGTVSNAYDLYGAGYASGADSDASVYGDVALSFQDAVYNNKVYLGMTTADNGSVLTVYGNSSISLEDSTAGAISGTIAVQGNATVTLLGATTLSSVWIENVAETFRVQVGDGETETHGAVQNYLYGNPIDVVSIQGNATLEGLDQTGNVLFWNLENLDIAETGTLVLAKMQNFSENSQVGGQGTIVFPASFTSDLAMVLYGGFHGTITLKTDAPVTAGNPLAWSKPNTTGTFTYGGEGYTLTRVHTGSWYRWDLTASMTVTAEAVGPGGTVSPASQTVAPGGD
ncbi:hypothetical protein, partial [uncultured Oscillibacter sp.]|uniref:hypothetical protein n=1 Tax=uncultured Oscillibacter sp. TaxID=876091 RepID=UPI002805C13A